VTIEQFMTDESFGRRSFAKSRNPYTCGLSGKTYSWIEMTQRVDFLSRAIGKRFGWQPAEGTPWDKVIAVFSLNAVDYMTAMYAVHRFSGISTPANAAYSALELQHQLTTSGASAVFTCESLLETTLKATRAINIPDDKVFLLDVPGAPDTAKKAAAKQITLDQLVAEGSKLPALEPVKWTKGQGARQPAFLCYSSGTSGLPVSGQGGMQKCLSVRLLIIPLTESRYDLPPQRHLQHPTDRDV
jgi:acyl-CoA synthetase (AMP-forming)/AMP-acid ligase II